MNEFLDKVWLDNNVRSYLVVTGVILFMLLVKKYIAHYVAGLLFHFIKTIWKDVDKKSFTSLVAKPLSFFLAILVTVITLYKLNFPQLLNVDIYKLTVKELLHTISSIILVISFIRLLLRIIDFIAIILHIRADRTHDTTDNQLIVFFKDFFKVILGIIGLLMILKFAFGFNISNVLTGLSIVGAAIALALRESLENLIASFIIFFDKPFSMGDVVKVQNFSGTVEKIGLRSTRIRTEEKTFITVPNKQMVDSIMDNLSQRTQRKGALRLELGLSTSSTELNDFITDLRQLVDKPEIESSTALLNDITPSAFIVLVDYFTGPVTMQEFNTIKEQINFDVLRLLESRSIEIAGASTDIKITSQPVAGS
jgi:MscS family membrane protein